MKRWILVLIGIFVVGSCGIGFWQYMKSYELDVTMMETIKPVRMIQANELITSNMVKVVSIPRVQHMENAMLNPEDIVGKRAIVPIGEAEEFLSWKIGEDTLYPKNNEEYLGFKAAFIDTVNNMVRRGDKVNVWVEYTTPKYIDAMGQEVDENQISLLLATNTEEPIGAIPTGWKKVYNKLLIENLVVAYVKDQEGKEVTDLDATNAIGIGSFSTADRDEAKMETYRQNASAEPSYITFIMNPEQYALVAEGQKEGMIKLGLPSTSVMLGSIVSNKKQASDNESLGRIDEPSTATNNEGGDQK